MSDTERNSRKRPADFEELFDDGEETKEAVESEDEMVDEDGNVVGDLDLTKAETQAWLVKVLIDCLFVFSGRAPCDTRYLS
jgi:transcription initiation factor TFIIF subunit beta